MRVLGIETSCDETGVALYDSQDGLLAEALHSQVDMHIEYGGVVPELASRDHIRLLLPLVEQVMQQSGIAPTDVDGIACTRGPGLIGALMVGWTFARALAFAWDRPLVGVHHMEGHLVAPMLGGQQPAYPFLALLVSGGHTLLVDVERFGQYRILGETLDDAVGEAFDKAAKMLGLGYPGGPAIARLAEKGDPGFHAFPRPMLDRPGCDFSFSGLKTAMLVQYRAMGAPSDEATLADLAASYQAAIVDTLVRKVERALRQTGRRSLTVAGGVGANTTLRTALGDLARKQRVQLFFPPMQWCTDNGAMIALAGAMRLASGEQMVGDERPLARWRLDELSPPGGGGRHG